MVLPMNGFIGHDWNIWHKLESDNDKQKKFKIKVGIRIECVVCGQGKKMNTVKYCVTNNSKNQFVRI